MKLLFFITILFSFGFANAAENGVAEFVNLSDLKKSIATLMASEVIDVTRDKKITSTDKQEALDLIKLKLDDYDRSLRGKSTVINSLRVTLGSIGFICGLCFAIVLGAEKNKSGAVGAGLVSAVSLWQLIVGAKALNSIQIFRSLKMIEFYVKLLPVTD